MGELTKAQLAAFARDVLRSLWDGCDMAGEDIQSSAEKHGLIRCVAFDPKVHADHLGVGVYPGDDWYVEHRSLKRLAALAASTLPGGAKIEASQSQPSGVRPSGLTGPTTQHSGGKEGA